MKDEKKTNTPSSPNPATMVKSPSLPTKYIRDSGNKSRNFPHKGGKK